MPIRCLQIRHALVTFVTLSLLSCNPDAGPPADAAACETDDDCRNDDLWCNGTSICEEQILTTAQGPWRVKLCVAGPPPCGSGFQCLEDVAAGRATCVCSNPDQDGDGVDSAECGGTDCDDANAARFPGATENCDNANLDEDCNPSTHGVRDADSDGSIDVQCCNEGNCGDDCDDTRADVHRTAVEACDQRDNDCDGAIDEGVNVQAYVDVDGDGWGQGASSFVCADAAYYANIDGDCDDDRSALHPGAFRCKQGGSGAEIEMCDGGVWTDDNCIDLGLCVPQPDGSGVCLPGGVFPECSDEIDNDDDGATDSSDPQCDSPLDNTEAASACSNGQDDDSDAVTDFPNDPGCYSLEDTSEEDPATPPDCSDGIDNDNDGTRDYVLGSGDPGCTSAADTSERQVDGPSCDNGVDDEGDGAADFPADKSCPGPDSDVEATPACSNGIDDDLDGLSDFGSDLGCDSTADDSERASPNSNYVCDNTVDDDLDGASDYPGDVGCTGPTDTAE